MKNVMFNDYLTARDGGNCAPHYGRNGKNGNDGSDGIAKDKADTGKSGDASAQAFSKGVSG